MSSAPLSHYLAYMRPRTFPVTFIFVLTGYVLEPHPTSAIAPDLAFLFVVYSVLIWGGANAFNSSQDLDEGPVNLLPNPPPIPPRLATFGLAVHVAAVAVALTRGMWPTIVTALLAIGSILYSWRGKRHRRLKEVPGLDNLINSAAFGIFPVVLGASLNGRAPSLHVVLVGAAFSVALFGGVPTSQIFQLRESDTVETARNWTVLLGPSRALRLGAVLFLAHIALLFAVAAPSQPTKTVFACWVGWLVLVLAAAAHSLWWARTPWTDPYRRMTRQLGMMMASQTIWVVGIAMTWLPYAGGSE